MAERRMMTKKVTDDDNFMQLSASAQALYLHLTMSADDDGFNNQVSVCMFKAHASVQDLQSLLERRYIFQFENGVIVIKHWRMANALRKDRYTPTAFQEELARLKIKDNGSYTMVAERLPDGCQMVAACLPQDRLGKDSIDEDIDTLSKDKVCSADAQRVIDAWNDLPSVPKVRRLMPTSNRYKMLAARIRDYGIDDVLLAVENVKNSPFLLGGGKQGWTIYFDWFVKPNNFPKVLDGNYTKGGNGAGIPDGYVLDKNGNLFEMPVGRPLTSEECELLGRSY